MGNLSEPTGRRSRGRIPSTSKDELGRIGLGLFIEHGFDNVTVDDIAVAAGIGRRTFFRYFPSKNDVVWGDFDALLGGMERWLAGVSDDVALLPAIRGAVVRFN